MVDYSETMIKSYYSKLTEHVPDIKVTLTLSKVTQNETGSQVKDAGPLVLWCLICQ